MLRNGEERLSSDAIKRNSGNKRAPNGHANIKHAEQLRACAGVVNGNQHRRFRVERARLNRLGDSIAPLLSIVNNHVAVSVLIGLPSVNDGRHVQPRRDILNKLLALVRAPLLCSAHSLVNRHFFHRRRDSCRFAHADFIVIVFDFHFLHSLKIFLFSLSGLSVLYHAFPRLSIPFFTFLKKFFSRAYTYIYKRVFAVPLVMSSACY